MSWTTGLISAVMSILVAFIFHPIENEVAKIIVISLSATVYLAMLWIEDYHEDKLEKRIRTLEKKLEDKEKGGESNA